MSRAYLAVVCGIVAALLVLFAGVEALGVSVLTDPASWLGDRSALAGALSVALLVADVVLPVASSAVMIANGAVFGLFVGALLSLAGSVGAAACAFALGRHGGGLLDRLVTQADKARADAFLTRWGDLAVLVSRPVPIAAETVALLAARRRCRGAALCSRLRSDRSRRPFSTLRQAHLLPTRRTAPPRSSASS